MVKSIEEYTAEVSRGYDNSRNALQNQINAIEGDLNKTLEQINQNYNNQQTNLNNQKNWAAESASLAASNNGGSFGGATEIANKKYYEQAFVPAQAQLDTSRNQSLDNARTQANSNKLTLETQLAAMADEISRLGVQRYYDELERERQEAARQQQIAAQNAHYQYLKDAAAAANNQTAKQWNFGNGYAITENNGNAVYSKDGRRISAGDFLQGTGRQLGGARWDLWNDIWNNNVSTNGVGSDTVEAFNGHLPYTPSNYAYLYGM